tara:strand:- start:1 stop:186 length:186 start_codon:yes stop_codon:yes gene_type:complete
LEHNVHGVANGNKNSNGVFLGGSDMVNVQKNLNPEPLGVDRLYYFGGSGVKLVAGIDLTNA